MKMQSIAIDGFKNLSDVTIKFDKITALVALNNFGKSNVLKGIDYALKFIKASGIDKLRMMRNRHCLPVNKNMFANNFKYEMQLSTRIKKQAYFVKYGFEFAWQTTEEEKGKIVREYLQIKPSVKNRRFVYMIKRDENGAFYRSAETGRCDNRVHVDEAELVVNRLLMLDKFYLIDIIEKINSMKIYMEDNYDVKSFYEPLPFRHKGNYDDFNDDNLPRIIYSLQEKSPDKFELLQYVFKQLFPNIDDIKVKKIMVQGEDEKHLPDEFPYVFSDAIYELFVMDVNIGKYMNFNILSDGAKRVFMILTKMICAERENVALIAIEEPENSIHPKLFQEYIGIIDQLLENCKVIITSHSPYIISCLSSSWIHIGVGKSPGIASFYSLSKTGQKNLLDEAYQMGESIGDYLFSLLSDEDGRESVVEYLECDMHE